MSAEEIAIVAADVQRGRIRQVGNDEEVFRLALARRPETIVDATAIYQSLIDRNGAPVDIYGDHPSIAPPFVNAGICYLNEHGNVIVMSMDGREHDRSREWEPEHHDIDWPSVRWVINSFVWIGGRSRVSGPFPTSGPMHLWRMAVYEDGAPADLRWVHLVPEYPMEHWDMAHLVLLGTLNFLNCRNVSLVEPRRHRHEARRIARHGVKIHTLSVFPAGSSSKSREREGLGVPLTSVRGHFACYGPDYGKGLLFGKLAGRFWVPQHARGDRESGLSVHDYELIP